jgi:hypothetical protein
MSNHKKSKTYSFLDNPGEKMIGCLKANMKSSLFKIKEEEKSFHTINNEVQNQKIIKDIIRKGTVYQRATSVACVKCPQCKRSFGLKAAETHIRYCTEKARQMINKPFNTKMTLKKERILLSQIEPPQL